MAFRSVLLILGLFCLCAGAGLSVLWLGQDDAGTAVVERQKAVLRPAILVTKRPLAVGRPLFEDDIGWKEVPDTAPYSGALVRGQVTEAEFVGAIPRRSFAEGEPLIGEDLVKESDRKFLAAMLGPGKRAVAVPVEAQQSTSGLVLPDDHVDVILTHVLTDTPGSVSGSVAETILHDVRVIAVDQTLTPSQKPADAGLLSEPKLPRVVTLEVDEAQAQTLVVGLQMGKLQLSLRSLQRLPAQANAQRDLPPTFASDISPALRQLASRTHQVQPTASSIESSIRRPPVLSN
jgi:pilus assembly protein CpaB